MEHWNFFETRTFFREQLIALITSALLTVYCKFYTAHPINLNPSQFSSRALPELSLNWSGHKLLEHPPDMYDIYVKSTINESKIPYAYFKVSSSVSNEDQLMKVKSWYESYRRMNISGMVVVKDTTTEKCGNDTVDKKQFNIHREKEICWTTATICIIVITILLLIPIYLHNILL